MRIVDEAALVTWDPATRTEHFLRRASFVADTADFGFLVPTPGKPTLTEGDDSVFERLERATRPEVVYRDVLSGIDPMPLLFGVFLLRATKSAPLTASVTVVDELRVAGYDAVVLQADSPSALTEWLKSHGYARGPEVEAWVAPYVARRWFLSAFRIAPKDEKMPDNGRIGQGAVDIAFTTDRPFYPYREPDSARGPNAKGPRSLAVYVVAPERASATLGDTATWVGIPTYARRMDSPVQGVPGGTEGRWLTAFIDRSSPRPGVEEVYFGKSPDSSPLIPPPVEIRVSKKIPVPIDVVIVLGTGLFFVGRAIRKRRERG